MLFSAYRRDDFADPEGFVTQLGAILCDFPEDVVNYVTSPKTGIQRRSKWPPAISEIITACEDHQEFLKRLRTERPALIRERLASPERPAGYLANQFVPEGHVRYQGLVEWSQTADPKLYAFGRSSDNRPGIWIARGIWESPPAPARNSEPAHG